LSVKQVSPKLITKPAQPSGKFRSHCLSYWFPFNSQKE
jgi:hypothetical protein